MKFVNARGNADSADPRENIILTGVRADITSAGLLLNRVVSSDAVYSEGRKLLELTTVSVESYNMEGSVEGLTSANNCMVFLDDNKAFGRHRNDIEFSGSVVHRAPDAEDPSTDTVTLRTERLLWDNVATLFRGTSPFRMVLSNRNKKPLVMVGDGFVAARNMEKWTARHGMMTTNLSDEPRGKSAAMRAEMADLVTRIVEPRRPENINISVPPEALSVKAPPPESLRLTPPPPISDPSRQSQRTP
ncbi:MAG: hypothetical protein WCK47_04025 [bacterium]|nr:hypothetical protein [Candidatus Sumerlaeota bacterium]